MKNFLIIISICAFLSVEVAFAAKYKVNSSGVVKTTSGKVVTPKQVQTNTYNVFTPSSYKATQHVVTYGTINLVMDYSGSMTRVISEVKKVMANIIAQIPSSTVVGLRVFGQSQHSNVIAGILGIVKKVSKENGKYKVVSCNPVGKAIGPCSATMQVAPFAKANSSKLILGMNSASIGSSTPMVYGLDRAINQDFVGMDISSKKKVILITDGGENCGGDPCTFAKELVKKRQDVTVDIILVGASDAGLSCLASTTDGKVYNINNISSLQFVLIQSITSSSTQILQKNSNTNSQYEFYND